MLSYAKTITARQGQSLVEYCVIVGAIVIALLALAPALANRISNEDGTGIGQRFLNWIP